MKAEELIDLYKERETTKQVVDRLKQGKSRIHLKGLAGSAASVMGAALFKSMPQIQLFVLPEKESAVFFLNDLENLLEEKDKSTEKKQVLFFPSSYKRVYEPENTDPANSLLRAEVLNRLSSGKRKTIVVSYPAGLLEQVVTKKVLNKNTLKINTGDTLTIDFISEFLVEYDFDHVDFVVEPGQFTVRGGIMDVYSYANDYPYRIEFFGDEIESIRTFSPETQLSVEKLKQLTIIPDLQSNLDNAKRESFLSYLPPSTITWLSNITYISDQLDDEYKNIKSSLEEEYNDEAGGIIEKLFTTKEKFLSELEAFSTIEFGKQYYYTPSISHSLNIIPQPVFNKNFELLIENLQQNTENDIRTIWLADSEKQIKRLHSIIEDIQEGKEEETTEEIHISSINTTLHEGFVDKETGIACYTDHQVFERYHKFRLKDSTRAKATLTLKELYNLQKGDFVTHIDHGIGKYDGLQRIATGDKEIEAARILYKEGVLYVSIHSLHTISKYSGKDGKEPTLNRLNSTAWKKLKEKTKSKVKDIARELIELYAKRRAAKGFAFSPDNYLQTELEASFIYEDTPDQEKATTDFKQDMENNHPMDRLICGDVGFGKTEIAIRAAFKAVCDSKQVAVLVPTTILALQHYNTFADRLYDFPCKVEYINRFKTAKQQKQIVEDTKNGKIDILIGTHRLVGKDIEYKDLGLLIVDEEQKFGVGVKEKLKQLRVNMDTLTLTATPIPRTLQFSMMGARDLSIINTAPPNRHPVQTELHGFSEKVIKDAIMFEIERGGQVYFVHNRVQNIMAVSQMIQNLCSNVKVAIAHGQMDGVTLEKTMHDFIDGHYGVLLATKIIESGLDIPNVNTIIINNAQTFGLSELHQLRGRVGRANKKSFCYLITPPLSSLADNSRKRLRAIEEFSALGSGFNIAMRDLDIRGAGNLLGGEQSGFISDIGFDTYHKILNEAIKELKEKEFKGLYATEGEEEFVRECTLETDLDISIPNDYINNISERLVLYKELSSIETETLLNKFALNIQDRFGPLPKETEALIDAVRLKWIAKETGFQKVVLKSNKFLGYFPNDEESAYFQSEKFNNILVFLKNQRSNCMIKEIKNKPVMSINNVSSIHDALGYLKQIE